MTLFATDLPFIVAACMGKRPSELKALEVEGDRSPGATPVFRIDAVDYGPGDPIIDGEYEYLHIMFTDVGTRETPLNRGRWEVWEVWVLTYGKTPDTWCIHIPERMTPRVNKITKRKKR